MGQKIIINGKFLSQRITGVQRFAREVLNELDLMVEHGEFQIAVEKGVENLPKYKNIIVVEIGNLHGNLWEQISLPRYVKKQKAKCLSLCNSAPIFACDFITIHDVKIKAHPDFFDWKFRLWYSFMFKKIIRKSKNVFTDSQFSKGEILKYYSCDPEKIIPVYLGWEHMGRISFDENTLAKYNLENKKFYFAIGSFDPNKNFKWIEEQAKRNPNEVYAISGSINKKVFSSNLGFVPPENMKLLGYVSDEEAKTLMRDCKAFLFPSIYEGFGIPPLEAIACGCKNVIVSNLPVFHELFGDYVNYIGSLKTRESHLMNMDLLEKYSWRKTALMLFSVIKNCL